jgi:hypothetical protein
MMVERNFLVRDNVSENGDDDLLEIQTKKSYKDEKQGLKKVGSSLSV